MIPELGHYTLILAFCFSFTQAIALFSKHFIHIARSLVYAQTACMTLSFFSLAYAFVSNDFSVAYVANNSHTQLPLIYRFCAVWGAHEGSLLLWAWLLSLWTTALAVFSRRLPQHIIAQVFSVLGFVSTGFLLFILFTSNPFKRLLPNVPIEGLDLNPLLQDPGLVIHPPILYMGYVGFSIAFAFAITALILCRHSREGQNPDLIHWARWARPWTQLAWCFLTLGIILGSGWAYRELGWGGWWFWDPVENASFLPWLSGTALLHSLSVAEKRPTFATWALLLAIISFSLSLLGTFLVRSGILISVHTFASDPTRGLFMLAFLALVVGISLTLYAWRVPLLHNAVIGRSACTIRQSRNIKIIPLTRCIKRVDSSHKGRGENPSNPATSHLSTPLNLLSRETFLLTNNLLLTAAMLTILLGTLYPLILDTLQLEKISVGAPYFNMVFMPFMGCILFLMGIVPFLRWQNTPYSLLKKLWIILVFACAGSILAACKSRSWSWGEILGLGLAFWVILSTIISLFKKNSPALSLKKIGMALAHTGLAVCVIGVVWVSNESEQKEIRLLPGDSTTVGGYVFEFKGVKDLKGPNYKGVEGTVLVKKDHAIVNTLYPQQRIYNAQRTLLAKTAIDINLFRDLYVALGEQLDNRAWSFRIYYKPLIRWIWGGGVVMILGCLMAFFSRIPRANVPRENHST